MYLVKLYGYYSFACLLSSSPFKVHERRFCLAHHCEQLDSKRLLNEYNTDIENKVVGPSTVAQACNHSYAGGRGGKRMGASPRQKSQDPI
jgi:hypothetical protein